jgi:hypothetical protein
MDGASTSAILPQSSARPSDSLRSRLGWLVGRVQFDCGSRAAKLCKLLRIDCGEVCDFTVKMCAISNRDVELQSVEMKGCASYCAQ